MKTNCFSPWRPACFLMVAFLSGLLILPLQSSLPAADKEESCDFRITIDAVIYDGAPNPITIGFDAMIELSGLPMLSSPTIAGSKVLVNHTIEVPMLPAYSTPGRRHFHRKFFIDVSTLGPEALIEVFAQKTGTVPSLRTIPPKPLASAKVNTKPRVTWISPAYNAIIEIKRDLSVSPPWYPPVEVKWRSSGFTGPYNLIVTDSSSGEPGPDVHVIRGLFAESYKIPASVFKTGKKYRVQVDNIDSPGIPLTISGPCSTTSSGHSFASAHGIFTIKIL